MSTLDRHREAVARFPDNELARFSLGKALFDQGQFEEALGHFEQSVAKRPDWMAVQILIGKCQLELGDRVGAVASFERARTLAELQHHDGPLAEMETLLADLQA